MGRVVWGPPADGYFAAGFGVPRGARPPLRPAARAPSALHSWPVPFSWEARPPLLAISRCFSMDAAANPRRCFFGGASGTNHLSSSRAPPAWPPGNSDCSELSLMTSPLLPR